MPGTEVAQIVINALGHLDIHHGPHGYFHCSRTTFRKLRVVHRAFWEDVRRLAEWLRWNAKDPKNRVEMKALVNAAGQPNGYVKVRNIPEPERPKFFPMVQNYRSRRMTVPDHLKSYGVLASYRKARSPVPTREKMLPLMIEKGALDTLYARIVLAHPERAIVED